MIGAVAIAGGSQRKKLPVLLAGGLEKIDKSVGFLAQGADAVGRGKGGDWKKDAAAAVHNDHSFCFDILRGSHCLHLTI